MPRPEPSFGANEADDIAKQTSPSSLQEMKDALTQAATEAQELADSQAENKRKQEELKKAIDSIDKDVTEFKAKLDDLRRDYHSVKHEVGQKLDCLRKLYPHAVPDLDKAVDGVTKVIADESVKLKADEKLVAGKSDTMSREAKRAEDIAQSRFAALAAKEVRNRIDNAKALLVEAKAVEGDPQKVGDEYALLRLAEERLIYTWHFTAVDWVRDGFAFPANAEDYEQKLVAAYNALYEAIRHTVEVSKQSEADKKAYADLLKAFADDRAKRKADTVAAAHAIHIPHHHHGHTPPYSGLYQQHPTTLAQGK